MKIFVLYFFTALLATSFQATFFHGTRPDFVFVLVYFYSIRHGQIKGMTYGALAGLLVDSASGFILGPNILSKSLTGFLIGSIRQKLFRWNAFISTLLIAGFSLVDILLVYICLETFADIPFFNELLGALILQVVYTTGLGLILYPALNPEKNSRPILQMQIRI